MIKMYINNEEVVSNKEFTISEEMLATPSTVLNNCYPALWENTKDYVSKFYFPKDYSKCIIGDGEFEKGSQRNIIKKVSGISPSFETNITKPWESLTIDGKSTQETRSGKNLFKPLNITNNGITTTYDKNGVGTIKGTSTSSWVNISARVLYSYPAGNYVLSIDKPKTFNVCIKGTYTDNEIFEFAIVAGSKTKNVALKKEVYSMYAYINGFAVGTTFNETIKIQLEKGTTATDYEPYGVMPSPDYPSEIENVKGKNLFKPTLKTTTLNGITCTANKDGTYTLNGTATKDTTFNVGTDVNLTVGKTYKLVGCPNGGSNTTYRIGWNYHGYEYGNGLISKKTSEAINVQITIIKGVTVSNLIFKPMFTENTSLTYNDYVPYGNIQIVETGKNLFDKDNADILNLYPASPIRSNAQFQSICIPIEPNTTYTLISSNHYSDGLALGTSEEYPVAGGTITNKSSVPKTKNNITITSGEDDKYLLAYIKWGTSISEEILNGIMLEKGSIATNYEPYTEEVVNIDLKGNELCSLSNGTKDELIVKDGRAKIVKRIGKVVLNGSEDWHRELVLGFYRFTIYLIDFNADGRREILSNYFKYSFTGNKVGLGFTAHTYLYLCPKQDITTVDEFKTWLSTHNTIVQYELAEPYEIDLGEVTLPNTLIGQNNVTLDATLETNMKISYYYSSYDLLFAGVVKKTGNISLNPRYPHYADIQVLDFKTFLSEGETLNFVIDNKTIGQAIDMVIDAIKSYGFVKGNIMLDDINEVIGAYSTDKKTAYDVFQYFSDITNSRWFTRMIDEDTVAIDFYDTDKLPVKPKIEYTEDWFCNNLIDDMSYSIKTDDYRNKQILLSDEVFGSTPYNDLLTSNGYDTSYTTTGKIASLTSAKIDGKNATFTTEANKEGGVEADIYYKPGEVGITTNNQIGAGKVIEITYIPLVEGREIIINDEEVNRIGSQLNRNGVISRYENRNDTTSSDELRQIGQTYIKYKGKAEVTLKITSRKNIYNIGDKVQFDAPLEDLSTEYMVKKKTTKYIVTANQLFYDYELSSSFNSESEINYFDNQRSKHKGNLSEGDYITRDIDITNSAKIIWHDTSIDEISITGNNILDCALDSPFTD